MQFVVKAKMINLDTAISHRDCNVITYQLSVIKTRYRPNGT